MMVQRTLVDVVTKRLAKTLRPRAAEAAAQAAAKEPPSPLRGAKKRVFDAVEVVTSLYEAVLGRQPDADGLAGYSQALERGAAVADIVGEFLRSKEFARRMVDVLGRYPLDSGGPMRVELHDTENQRGALWRHVAEVWSSYGTTDPYWSVLTAERWRAANVARAEVLEEFYDSGAGDMRRFEAWLARNGLQIDADVVCTEYGCGVGRCTVWLARRFRRVVAFDISQPHLDAARAATAARGIDNVEFVLVRGPDDLPSLNGADVFYSILVLQHNPPPITIDILDAALKGLKRGGIAFFQIPTYSCDYSFVEEEYENFTRTEKAMEMHCVPQRMIFDLAFRHGLQLVEVQPDGMIGGWGSWISNTFLLRSTA
jgi:SAM-dependent methyltransferase